MTETLSEASAAMNDRRAERDSRNMPCGFCKVVRVGCIVAACIVLLSLAVAPFLA